MRPGPNAAVSDYELNVDFIWVKLNLRALLLFSPRGFLIRIGYLLTFVPIPENQHPTVPLFNTLLILK